MKLLSARNVNYVIVGAYTMAAHGFVRATGDIDIFLDLTPENSEAVFASLVDFGAPLSAVTAEDFRTPGTVYQIGVPPNRIAILTDIDGLTFEEAGSCNVGIDGLAVPVLDLESLKRDKAATGRTKDKFDLESLSGE